MPEYGSEKARVLAYFTQSDFRKIADISKWMTFQKKKDVILLDTNSEDW